MKSIPFVRGRWAPLFLLASLWAGVLSVPAGVLQTQIVDLQAGWNSVALEVRPAESRPSLLFGNTPIQIAAVFLPGAEPRHYPRDPVDHPWQEEGWAVWYHPSRPDALLSDLHALVGTPSMLIYSSNAFRWEIVGERELRVAPWKPNAYNFRGFGVEAATPPSFAAYFDGSTAHRGQKYFRLVDGRWSLVREPATTLLRAGEAYWIYCAGASDYSGPIDVKVTGGRGLNFAKTGNLLEIQVRNAGTQAAKFTLEAEAGVLPLSYKVRDWAELEIQYPDLPPALELGEFGAGKDLSLTLLPRREAMTGARQSALLRLSNGQGAQVWLPVSAERP